MICRFERQVIVLLGENVPARVGDWVTPLAQGGPSGLLPRVTSGPESADPTTTASFK